MAKPPRRSSGDASRLAPTGRTGPRESGHRLLPAWFRAICRVPPAPLLLTGAFLCFTAALADAAHRFALLPGAAHAVVSSVAAVLVILVVVRRGLLSDDGRRIVVVLSAAALLALSCRIPLIPPISVNPESAIRAADRVDAFLANLTREVGDAAYLVARTPAVAAALEGSDAGDTESRAFRALADRQLPETNVGAGGATLYDRQLRPVAWSGGNPDLEEALAEVFPDGVRAEDCPDPAFPLFIYSEGGRRSYLAAAECTRNLLGIVTVELPLREASPPSSGAPPLSALETAARRGLDSQILDGAQDVLALAQLFERRGDRFLDGSADAQRYYFALRAYDGQLLGAASTPVAPVAARRAEREAEFAGYAALVLLVGALIALPGLWRHGDLGALAAIWTLRFSLSGLLDTLPAGPGAALPVFLSGPPLLPILADSALMTIVTATALFLSARILGARFRRGSVGRSAAGPGSVLRGLGAGTAAVTAAALVQNAGFSGGAPLTPTWAVETGWPEVVGWAALLLALAGLLLLLQSLLRPQVPALVAAAAVVAASAALLPGSSVLFAAFPLAAATALSWWRRGRVSLRHLRQPLLSHEPGFAFVVAFLLFAVPSGLLYPAMAWHEDNNRRRYALDAAPVQMLRHRFAVCHALEEATRTLDTEAAALARLRPDTAYRLWLATGLPRLTVASALEVRGPGGERSRFGVGLPRRPDPFSSAPPPLRWSPVPACEAAPGTDAVLETQRLFPSGLSITLRAADRTAEIPFLPRAAGIADHFLLRGDAAPAVFRRRDLRLDRRPPAASGDSANQRIAVDVLVNGERFVVSWRRTGAADHAAALLGWWFLAALVALLVAVTARLRLFFPGRGGRLRRRSFQMQLTETLAAAVLVAILGVAVFAQQRIELQLQAASDQEAIQRSSSVQRVAQELAALDPLVPGAELTLRLAQAADQLDTDAALYNGGALVAISRPELAQTGLLPPRPPPAAILPGASADPFLSIQEAGPLRYRIVWIHLETPARLHGPLLLAVPLPADEAARLESVRAIQRTLLLGSGSLALVFAIVVPGLLARRLAAPVRGLAHATGRIADGDLEAQVPVHGTLTELRLLAANVERLVRRIPDVRRRMREEATADLARRVAHDIKNALAPIGLAADYIRRVQREPRGRNPQDAVEESVSEILGQVERLRRISSEFSALGAPLRLERVDLTKLVKDTVAPYLRSRTGPRITFSGAPTRTALADPEIVARIVENLMQNALEAMHDSARLNEEDAEISVRVFPVERDRRIRIEVEDNGPGVPRDLRERIFDAAFSTRTRGSGLGLANARRFAEAHAGRVRAGSRTDGGSGLLLTVEIPVDGPPGTAEP